VKVPSRFAADREAEVVGFAAIKIEGVADEQLIAVGGSHEATAPARLGRAVGGDGVGHAVGGVIGDRTGLESVVAPQAAGHLGPGQTGRNGGQQQDEDATPAGCRSMGGIRSWHGNGR